MRSETVFIPVSRFLQTTLFDPQIYSLFLFFSSRLSCCFPLPNSEHFCCSFRPFQCLDGVILTSCFTLFALPPRTECSKDFHSPNSVVFFWHFYFIDLVLPYFCSIPTLLRARTIPLTTLLPENWSEGSPRCCGFHLFLTWLSPFFYIIAPSPLIFLPPPPPKIRHGCANPTFFLSR